MDGIRRKVTKREMGLFWFIYLGEFGSVLWFCAYVYCFGLVFGLFCASVYIYIYIIFIYIYIYMYR